MTSKKKGMVYIYLLSFCHKNQLNVGKIPGEIMGYYPLPGTDGLPLNFGCLEAVSAFFLGAIEID